MHEKYNKMSLLLCNRP